MIPGTAWSNSLCLGRWIGIWQKSNLCSSHNKQNNWNIPSSWHLSKVCLPSRLVTGDQATHQCWEQPYHFPGKQAYIDLGAKVHESIVLDWGLLVSGHYWLKEDCRNMFVVYVLAVPPVLQLPGMFSFPQNKGHLNSTHSILSDLIS